MASRNKKTDGLDISGAGKHTLRLSGGDMRHHSGLQLEDAQRYAALHAQGGVDGIGGQRTRRAARKTIVLIVVLVVVSLALAAAVGFFVYQMTVKNALLVTLDPSLESELSAVEEDAAGWWGALASTDAGSAEDGHGNLSDVSLVFVNTKDKSIAFLWLPADTQVYLDGYGHRTLAESFSLAGEAGLVTSLEKLAGVDISHYGEFNRMGISRLAQDLSLADASSFDGQAGQAGQAAALADAAAKKVFGSSSEQIEAVSGTLDACMSTDMTRDEIEGMVTDLQGIRSDRVYQADAPSTEASEDGQTYSTLDTDDWRTMVVRTGNGMTPVASEAEEATNAQMRSEATVDIWNGVGISGIAADCATALETLGWHIGDTGNASQFIYDETLIVYKDTDDEDLAELLASDLRQGRVVKSGARYSFDATLLVVIGQDYQP